MRRAALLLCLLLAGCSTAPVADFLDRFKPGRLPSNGPFHGGVGAPAVNPPPPP